MRHGLRTLLILLFFAATGLALIANRLVSADYQYFREQTAIAKLKSAGMHVETHPSRDPWVRWFRPSRSVRVNRVSIGDISELGLSRDELIRLLRLCSELDLILASGDSSYRPPDSSDEW